MKEYIYYWTSRPSKNAIRVKAIVDGKLSFPEHLRIAQLKEPDVTIIVFDGETHEELFSGNYKELRKWLSEKPVHEVRAFSEGFQHKQYYLTVIPPIKG